RRAKWQNAPLVGKQGSRDSQGAAKNTPETVADNRANSSQCLHREKVLRRAQLSVPAPAVSVSHCPRRGAEVKRDLLYPCRGVSGRGDEARPDSADRPPNALCLSGPSEFGLRKDRI